MLKDITLGQYIPGDTLVHKLDPRVKIMGTLLFMILLFFVKKFWVFGVIAIVLASIVGISKIRPKYIYRGLKPIFILLIFTAILNVFMTKGGDLILKLGFLEIYTEGVSIALFMAVRLVLLIVSTSILTLTTSPIQLTDGLEKLLNPLKKVKFPAHELAMIITIALRFIPTLLDETDKIMKAQMSRGADFKSGNIVKRAKSLLPILIPLFINSFKRADELGVAMEARCYRGGAGRTRMKVLKFETRDYVSIIVGILYTVFIISTRYFI
ncbi:energy-coupling factor transport system permease protein [Hathewaya proteolytica DSM 3090]|uniref:Energy-coupling factor transporter transmembrane protein EcfT n=1 Tax=Hathewaya proteolytica DSM 3090 TaxID=1121331 RepID=A0A1M6SU61_9CLOT|nr:energy-coupling factor transporter transmembrane component T [Hathewaya proteolytica]SHK48187.1 energy-coupling factor transport system permease protein [Hathewaya proteolytica DSM 3090]